MIIKILTPTQFLYLHRLCKFFHLHIFFETPEGLKCFNKPVTHVGEREGCIIELSVDQLFLGFDGLRDEYTLCGIPIKQSPHYNMIRLANAGADITTSEYVKREANGTLDGRFKATISPRVIKYNLEQSLNHKGASSRLPVVYQVDERYYILDGKHRLAKCALQGSVAQCQCIDKTFFKKDAYTLELYRKIQYNPNYSINKQLLTSILQ